VPQRQQRWVAAVPLPVVETRRYIVFCAENLVGMFIEILVTKKLSFGKSLNPEPDPDQAPDPNS
jgi:hypothetical protein